MPDRSPAQHGSPPDFAAAVVALPGPIDDAALAALVADHAHDAIRLHMQVPTIARYAQVVDPASHPLAAAEVAQQVLRVAMADRDRIQAELVARHPDWAPPLAAAALALDMLPPPIAAAVPVDVPAAVGPVLEDGMPRYRTGAQVAAGSYGSIHLATDRLVGAERPEPDTVVKFLAPRGGSAADWRLEARVAATVRGPCGVRFLDGGTTPTGTSYVVMERIDGRPLTAHAAAEGALPAESMAEQFRALAGAVASMHEAGHVHGDISPANVMIDRVGRLRLVDYGQGRPAAPGDTAQDVRLLATLMTWTILGYVPTARARLPRALGPVELALLRVSIAATHAPPTAAEFGDRLSAAAQRARSLRSWVLTVAVVGAVIAVLAVARFAFTG